MAKFKTHPELDVFRCEGGMFDVPPCEMDLNVGRRGRFLQPACPNEQHDFTVVAVQRDYRRNLVYRVHMDPYTYEWKGRIKTHVDTFGCCASLNEIELFDEAT